MFAAEPGHKVTAATSTAMCSGFGPQTPRDIDSKEGKNNRAFATAPAYDQMNLCNIHFHENAEARKFTAKADDWILFLEIACESKSQGLAIEKHIKKMKSRICFSIFCFVKCCSSGKKLSKDS